MVFHSLVSSVEFLIYYILSILCPIGEINTWYSQIFYKITWCKVLILLSFLSLADVYSVAPKNNLHSCLTVTFITFSIQMFYWKSWVCAIIPLFNLQKDITQRYLVEHKGLWIRIKVQRSDTVPEPGSYFDAPKPGFYEKGWAIMHQCYGQLPFLWFD